MLSACDDGFDRTSLSASSAIRATTPRAHYQPVWTSDWTAKQEAAGEPQDMSRAAPSVRPANQGGVRITMRDRGPGADREGDRRSGIRVHRHGGTLQC